MKQELKILSDEEFHLLEKAKQEGKIDEFIIEEAELFRDNVYCQQNFHIESLLKAVRKEKTVSIFMYKNDKVRQASFSLPEAATKEDFERELSDAIETAVFNENPTFSLPKKGDEASDESHIPREFFLNTKEEGFEGRRINLKVQEWIQIMKKKIEEAEDEELSLKLNYVEVFNKLVKHRLRTSTQLDKVDSKCSGYLEFVVTAIDKKTKKETEHIVYEHLSDIDTFAFEPYFEEQLQFAKDSARAKAAKTFSGKILLLNHAVSDFFVPDLRP
ncbi:MAG: hypothetical protein KC548_04255, partial [Nanoarchaeota archaeon]|nr:hypothetical protein [Nanoarchaeota archaeon]